ncbi:MAG: PilZ domain-containing protein [Candidatus Omnitrophica bacterium]|nr:PilZ domain-containing protein [Candidatus Omnitrophota bacterium]MDD5430167.1 PilZ domain-containing protein [Candidatus Omnitrophota bacterium]
MKKKEKRKFARLRIHHLIKYKVIDAPKKLSFSRNISAGGLLFYASGPVPVGKAIELDINFPVYKKTIKAVCRIVRVRTLKKMSGFDVAAEFIDIEKDAQNFIKDKILKVYEKLEEKKRKT